MIFQQIFHQLAYILNQISELYELKQSMMMAQATSRNGEDSEQSSIREEEQFEGLEGQEINKDSEYIKKHYFQGKKLAGIGIFIVIIFLIILGMTMLGHDKNQETLERDKMHHLLNSLKKQNPLSTLTSNSKEIQKKLNYMMKRPAKKNHKPNQNFKPTQHAYFAYSLYKQPNNKQFLEAEYFYYELKYNISKYKQLPLCIVTYGRNLESEGRFQRFFQSIAVQNYSNYKLIFLDDASKDGTVSSIRKFLNQEQFNFLKQRTKIKRNSERSYDLVNKNLGIKNHCGENDIVIDIDPSDAFIGRQAFKFINSVYQNEDVWIFYTNYVYWSSAHDEPSEGVSARIPFKILSSNKYRTYERWLTSATRTFRRKLFLKIDDEDFKDEQGMFHKWGSNFYIHYALVELAGAKHYKYIDEVFYYFYRRRNQSKATEKTIDQFNARSLTPYQPLKSLKDQPHRVSHYRIPTEIKMNKKVIEEQFLLQKANNDQQKQKQINKKYYFQSQIYVGP